MPEGGAEFVLQLPSSRGGIVITQKPAPRPCSGKVCRILVVDDEKDFVAMVRQNFVRSGHQVDGAFNGKGALAKLRRNAYDFILLDLAMPGSDGRDIYRAICEYDGSLAKKILFVTGNALDEQALDFFVSNKIPYVTKPFEFEELESAMAALASSEGFGKHT